MSRFLLFAIGSAAIAWISRRSLLAPRSHGFPRFIAFEAVLGLVVLNAVHWFESPLAPRQLVSWSLLSVSAVMVVWGFALLRRRGGFRPADETATTFAWESTGRLVTSGIYRHVRHPMYSSLLFLAWGAVFKHVTPFALLLGIAATAALLVTAVAEEAENLAAFGEEYRDYMKRTRRFVPFVF